MNFSIEMASAMGFGYTKLTSNWETFSANYSLILHIGPAYYAQIFTYYTFEHCSKKSFIMLNMLKYAYKFYNF